MSSGPNPAGIAQVNEGAQPWRESSLAGFFPAAGAVGTGKLRLPAAKKLQKPPGLPPSRKLALA